MTNRHRAGFTLVDVSIMLAVIGLLAASLLTSGTTDREAREIATTRARLDRAQTAIASFYKWNGYLPCPALRTLAPGAAGYRLADCATASGSSITNVGTGNAMVRIGILPSRSLGLPDDGGLDGWGNALTYAMIRDMGTLAGFAAYNNTTNTDGVINVQTNIPSDATPLVNRTGDYTTYVIVSHGKDGVGAYRPNGTQKNACGALPPTGPADSENCNNDALFRDYAIQDTVGPAAPTWFYDLLRYRRKAELVP